MRASEFTGDEALAAYVDELGGRLAETQRDEIPERLFESLERTVEARGVREPDLDSVYGAAIVGTREEQRPALLVNGRLLQDQGPDWILSEWVGSVLERLGLLGERQTILLPIDTPRPQFDPGSGAEATGAKGTFGARVKSAEGEEGILTAGHLATKDSLVRDLGGRLGNVVFSVDPAQVPALTVTADIAVVVPLTPAPPAAPSPLYAGYGSALPGTAVTVYGAASGVQHAAVMGLVTPSLFVPSMSGQWASTYILTRAASKGGDSGAPVVRDDTKELIGHVVGGDEQTTTFVQSIDVQLAAANAAVQ